MAYFHTNLRYHEDTTEKRKLSKEDVEFLKALQKERNTQDNCETADVRTWVIKDRKDTPTSDEYADYYQIIDNEEGRELSVKELYEIISSYSDEYDEIEIDEVKYDQDSDKLEFLFDGKSCQISGSGYHEDGISIYGYLDSDEFVDFLENRTVGSYRWVAMRENWEHKFCFLTQKAAENYLRRKSHNHHPNAHTYCICTYQDPEIARLMGILEHVDWDKVGAINE
jgi:hypothetical protein